MTFMIAPAPQANYAPDRADGRARVVIEGVRPQIDGGLFPVKRVAGDRVTVEADVFADGHDSITAVVTYRHCDEASWTEVPLRELVNDRWTADFVVEQIGE